jgi:folate-dependent tRNA-U54 methylase TrmFO/GidA
MGTTHKRTKVVRSGFQAIASDRKDFSQKVTKEIAEWSAVVKAAGVKAE